MSTKPKIDLTPELEIRIEAEYQKYIKMGYTTKPADRSSVEAAIKRIYKREGLGDPNFFWFQSPDAARKAMDQKGVEDHKTNLWGAYDLYWLAFYAVGEQIAKEKGEDIYTPEDSDELKDMLAIAGATLWWPFDDCLVCDTPASICTDEAGNLHNDVGPAIEYRDGVKLWYIHGVEVTEKIVMKPQTIKPGEITKEINAEVKRIMIDRFGAGDYAKSVGAIILDTDRLGLEGSAQRVLVRIENGGLWLIGSDGGTGRVYWMSVQEGVETCRGAHESISGCNESLIVAQS